MTRHFETLHHLPEGRELAHRNLNERINEYAISIPVTGTRFRNRFKMAPGRHVTGARPQEFKKSSKIAGIFDHLVRAGNDRIGNDSRDVVARERTLSGITVGIGTAPCPAPPSFA